MYWSQTESSKWSLDSLSHDLGHPFNSAENKLSANRVGVVGRGRDGDRVATVGLRRRAKACHDAWQQVAPLVGQGENLDIGDLDPGKLVSVE